MRRKLRISQSPIKYYSSDELKIVPVNEVSQNLYRILDDEKKLKDVCKDMNYPYNKINTNKDGYKECLLYNEIKSVITLEQAIQEVPFAFTIHYNTVKPMYYYPCYLDILDTSTLRFVLIFPPNEIQHNIDYIDRNFLNNDQCKDINESRINNEPDF
jgi:hypothetical protein